MDRLPLALAALLLLPASVRAGAWALKPGAGKAAFSGSFLSAATVTDADGDEHDYGLRQWGLSTYGEVGVLPRLSAGWAWTFLLDVESDSLDKAAVADPELSLTWHAGRRGPYVFALQALGQFPLGPENPARVPDFAPALFSQGTYAFELRPLVGWARGKWWAQGGLGARLRGEDMAAQFRYGFAAGRSFGPFGGLLSLDGVVPLDGTGSGRPGDQELFYGLHLGGDWRFHPRAWAGLQVDSMLSPGQEMPLGARFNAFARTTWR